VQIGLRDLDLFCFERQMKLTAPTCLASELHAAAMTLLRACVSWQKPLRSIGLGRRPAPRGYAGQLSIFETRRGGRGRRA
jgi:hypothetical protein